MRNDNESCIFQLFPSIVIVEGKTNDAIYDLQRVKYYIVPKTFTYILRELSKRPLCEVYSKVKEKEILESYLSFIQHKELGLFVEEKIPFKDFDLAFVSPSIVHSAILDFDDKSNYPYEKALSELNHLRCKSLEVRFYSPNQDKLNDILYESQSSTLQNIEICHPYCDTMSDDSYIIRLKEKYPRVTKLILHSAPLEKEKLIDNKLYQVIVSKERLIDESCCGVISKWYFFPNTWLFLLSNNYNNCLWGKISVDRFGHIKNCPSMKTSYGHISEESLSHVLKKEGFTDLWHIKKDNIESCKECEMRYMCQDCRAYIENPHNILSKPIKCS